MSGRDETLRRTRCPACGTVFRVTAEQLRLRAGMVRCGQCQHVFNAFEHWQDCTPESLPEALIELPQPEAADPVVSNEFPGALGSPRLEDDTPSSVEAVPEIEAVAPAFATATSETSHDAPSESVVIPDVIVVMPGDPETPEAAVAEPSLSEPEFRVETPAESTQAARDVGLVAARELAETPAFNRWAAGTLASDGVGGFASDTPRRAIWPFTLVALLLAFSLVGQLALHFRTELVRRMPSLGGLYAAADMEIPLSRNAALVSIEASDLQSDNARGLFVLQATLKNRADHSQAWPALELALTDVNDAVVSRRVMFAADYLPPGTSADAFPANSDMAVRLWLEAKEISASGYRLYVFYP